MRLALFAYCLLVPPLLAHLSFGVVSIAGFLLVSALMFGLISLRRHILCNYAPSEVLRFILDGLVGLALAYLGLLQMLTIYIHI